MTRRRVLVVGSARSLVAASLVAAAVGRPFVIPEPSLRYRAPRSKWGDGHDAERQAAADAKRARKAAKLRG